MDFNSLPRQNTKEYGAIDYNNIMPLYDYHPWDGGHNPRIDKTTTTLLNIKSGDQKRYQSAVNFFTKVLTNATKGLARLVDSNPNVYCIVPSHTQDQVSPGLLALAKRISPNFHFSNNDNLLRRTRTVAKAATGGARNQHIHLDSIEVTDVNAIRGQTVFLFDDVSSTGSSMLACKQLLLNSGAERVAMIALGQTYMDH